MKRTIAVLRENRRKLLEAQWVSQDPDETYAWYVECACVQGETFMIDMIPYIHWFFHGLPAGIRLKLLDAGCGTGAGTELLGRLHRGSFLRHAYEVVGIDMSDECKNHADLAFDNMTYIIGDVFDIPDESYDAVICSHAIEHFEDPTDFMEKLRRIARYFALFYCPFEEEKLLEGHLLSIGRDFIEAFNPSFVEAELRSPGNTRSIDCRVARCSSSRGSPGTSSAAHRVSIGAKRNRSCR